MKRKLSSSSSTLGVIQKINPLFSHTLSLEEYKKLLGVENIKSTITRDKIKRLQEMAQWFVDKTASKSISEMRLTRIKSSLERSGSDTGRRMRKIFITSVAGQNLGLVDIFSLTKIIGVKRACVAVAKKSVQESFVVMGKEFVGYLGANLLKFATKADRAVGTLLGVSLPPPISYGDFYNQFKRKCESLKQSNKYRYSQGNADTIIYQILKFIFMPVQKRAPKEEKSRIALYKMVEPQMKGSFHFVVYCSYPFESDSFVVTIYSPHWGEYNFLISTIDMLNNNSEFSDIQCLLGLDSSSDRKPPIESISVDFFSKKGKSPKSTPLFSDFSMIYLLYKYCEKGMTTLFPAYSISVFLLRHLSFYKWVLMNGPQQGILDAYTTSNFCNYAEHWSYLSEVPQAPPDSAE